MGLGASSQGLDERKGNGQWVFAAFFGELLGIFAALDPSVVPSLSTLVAYCPHPVTVYIRGPFKGYI